MTTDELLDSMKDCAADIRKGSAGSFDARVLAGIVSNLVDVVREQNERIVALEYCKAQGAPAMPHTWATNLEGAISCQYCGTVRR